MDVFQNFETGQLFLSSDQQIDLQKITWSPHPEFRGVALKHLITAKDTAGAFSYHLVRIAPQNKIGLHCHRAQLETHEVIAGSGLCNLEDHSIDYQTGTIAVLPANNKHEVIAEAEGLFLFAKFIPALC